SGAASARSERPSNDPRGLRFAQCCRFQCGRPPFLLSFFLSMLANESRGAPDGGRASAKEPHGKSESISCITKEILTRDPVLQHVDGPLRALPPGLLPSRRTTRGSPNASLIRNRRKERESLENSAHGSGRGDAGRFCRPGYLGPAAISFQLRSAWRADDAGRLVQDRHSDSLHLLGLRVSVDALGFVPAAAKNSALHVADWNPGGWVHRCGPGWPGCRSTAPVPGGPENRPAAQLATGGLRRRAALRRWSDGVTFFGRDSARATRLRAASGNCETRR